MSASSPLLACYINFSICTYVYAETFIYTYILYISDLYCIFLRSWKTRERSASWYLNMGKYIFYVTWGKKRGESRQKMYKGRKTKKNKGFSYFSLNFCHFIHILSQISPIFFYRIIYLCPCTLTESPCRPPCRSPWRPAHSRPGRSISRGRIRSRQWTAAESCTWTSGTETPATETISKKGLDIILLHLIHGFY